MSAALPPSPALISRKIRLPTAPPPDSTEGRALIVGLVAAACYILLLVGANTPVTNFDWLWVPLVLILATIVSFNLGARLDSDVARARLVELELARTVAVHSGSGQLPEERSPLGQVLTEYAKTASALRQRARVHAYAAGPALWGALFALAAALLWGLSYISDAVWLNYLAIVVELPAFALLFYAVGVLALNVGAEREVEGFASLTPRRWRRHDERSATLDRTIATLPWLATAGAPPSATSASSPEEPPAWKEPTSA